MRFIIGCILLLISSGQLLSQSIERLPFEPFPNHTAGIIYASTFSKDMNEVYFVKRGGQWGRTAERSTIYFSKKEAGNWTTPVVASFSGEFSDNAPHLSPNERTLYFTSNRGNTQADIWKVEKDEKGDWGSPIRLDDNINSTGREYSPKLTNNGDLYFASDREGGFGQGDIYVAKKTANGFAVPQNLGSVINTASGEWNLCIGRDGKILIVEASGRAENKSSYGDLYISFKEDGRWSAPQNMKELNTTGSDLYPELVENQKYLYYASSDSLASPNVNIHKVRIRSLLRKYRNSANYN